MVVGGLKFTGLALNIATDLARSLSTEAAASVAKIDAEVTAQARDIGSYLTMPPSFHTDMSNKNQSRKHVLTSFLLTLHGHIGFVRFLWSAVIDLPSATRYEVTRRLL